MHPNNAPQLVGWVEARDPRAPTTRPRAAPPRRPRRPNRRGAAIYVVVLGTALVVSLLGLSALLAKRVRRRIDQDAADVAAARLYAQAAIEMGMLRIENSPSWRTSHPNGTWSSDQAIGDGTYTLLGVDPDDADLTDDDGDPVVLTGIGVHGRATQKMQVTLVPYEAPLEALRTCLHAGGKVTIATGKSITVTGAPLSTNNNVNVAGTVNGDVECLAKTGTGTVTGTVTTAAGSKSLPDADLFDQYKSIATEIPFSGDLDSHVLAPGVNTYGGGLNADGLYYMNIGSSTLTIQATRIHGTLVVETTNPTAKVVLAGAALLENYRADYPVLIVKGKLEVALDSETAALDESAFAVNFNPAGAPYQGTTDADQADVYPSEVRGLVHVTGTLTLSESARIEGAVIAEGAVTCGGANEIVHAPGLYENPPVGYLEPMVMRISPGTWCQVVD